MKKQFKKAMTVLASTAMLASTVAMGLSASYPEPFVGNSAVVVGSGADGADGIAAGNIVNNLNAANVGSTSSGTATVSGGDSYQFEKASTKFHLGDNITAVVSSDIDDDELPSLLGDGEYLDNDNDEFDFTQKIKIDPALRLTMFNNDDYSEDDPTLGFEISSGTRVLNYTLDFTEEPLVDDLVTSDVQFMGKSYYVLSNGTSGSNLVLTLLDSASDTILSEGETSTMNIGGITYTSTIEFVSSTEVKLNINGETTNSIAEGQTYKLDDGSYVGIKDILYSSKDTGISKVEFSIGTGRLILTGGQSTNVKINDDTVNGLTVAMVNDTGVAATGANSAEKLSEITLIWEADDDLFITEDSSITMPGFGSVKLSYGGITFPLEERFTVKQGADTYAELDNFPLKDGTADIPFLYGATAGAFSGIGKDANNQLLTGASGTEITFIDNTHDYFVASWNDGDDSESYLVRAVNIEDDGTNNITDFEYFVDNSWISAKTNRKGGDTFDIGNVEISVVDVNKSGSTRTVSLINNSANTNFNELYSKEGLKVNLPYAPANATLTGAAPGAINFTGTTAGHNATSFYLAMAEEDKDGNTASGDVWNVTVGWDSSSTAEVEVSDLVGEDETEVEIGDTDIFRAFMYSALATEFLYKKPSSGQDELEIIYHGEEAEAAVFISAEATTITSEGSSTGVMSITDDAVATAAGKNLIVVGGSAINSVAAELLGGAYSGDAFTAQTGVAAGQFLIQSFTRSGNTALLVAGYNAADTTKAATYLLNTDNDVDTSVGTKYVGSDATSANLIVA